MQRGKQNWTVQNILKMYEDKKTLSFTHPIQRAADKWTNLQKSLLVQSMLANYPIPNIYVLREDSEQLDEKGKPIFNFYVLDGKQRLTNTIGFINGEYPLENDIPNIFIEDEEYEIAGKYFVDLADPVRYEILRYKYEIVTFEDCTNEDVETIFYRLNNSTVLTKSQIAKSSAGVEMAVFINELLTSKFFTESANFTKAQLKSEDPQRVLFQSMMLLDDIYVDDFTLKDFSENTILDYAASIKNQYGDKQRNLIRSALEFLEKAFPQKDKEIRKVHIPMLVMLSDFSMNVDVKPLEFRQWWEYFNNEDKLLADYKQFCSSGSTRLDKIKGRIAIILKSYCWYQDIDYPEEWLETLEEVEAKLEEKAKEMESVVPEQEAADDSSSEEPLTEEKPEEKMVSEDTMSEEGMEQEPDEAGEETSADDNGEHLSEGNEEDIQDKNWNPVSGN